MAWWMAAIPIGMGLLKSNEQQKNYRDAQRVEAVKEKWSPWTGRAGENLQRPSAVGPIMQGATQGAAMYQNYQDYLKRNPDTGGDQPEMNFTDPTFPTTEGYQGRTQMPAGGGLRTAGHNSWESEFDMAANQNPSHRNWVPEGPSRY